jgi:Bifunctional DNA primase/polymerase, N-terminal
MSALFDAALAYAQRGLPVFPLWPVVRDARGYFICGCSKLECPNPGKHPLPRLAPNGLKDASTDPAKVKHWWFVWPSANVGIATHGLVVVDVDPRHHGDATMRELVDRYGPLPATWRVNTGGCGLHIYFLPPDGIQISSGGHRYPRARRLRRRPTKQPCFRQALTLARRLRPRYPFSAISSRAARSSRAAATTNKAGNGLARLIGQRGPRRTAQRHSDAPGWAAAAALARPTSGSGIAAAVERDALQATARRG